MEKFGYTITKLIGQGTFGKAMLCRSSNNHLVCIKMIPYHWNIINEVYIVSQAKHPRIVEYISTFFLEDQICIVMEFVPNGNLQNFLKNRISPLPIKANLNIFRDILSGMEYLHIRHIIHCDLKPENILMDQNNRPKIADFGISSIQTRGGTLQNNLGTPMYQAPEIMNGKPFDFKADIWSLGCIFYELFTLESPFVLAQDYESLREIINDPRCKHIACYKIPKCYGLSKLCQQMLTKNPQNRISICDIIRNYFIVLNYYACYFDYI